MLRAWRPHSLPDHLVLVVGVGQPDRAARLHDGWVTKRAAYMFALYSGSLAESGDQNPYSGRSLVLAQLWMHGYMRMLSVGIESGPAMQSYRAARGETGAEGSPA